MSRSYSYFIRNHATEEDLQELESLIKDRIEGYIEVRDIKKEIQLDKQNKLDSIKCLENCAVKNIKRIAELIKEDVKNNINSEKSDHNGIKYRSFKENYVETLKGKVEKLNDTINDTIYVILNNNKNVIYIGTSKEGKIVTRLKEHLVSRTVTDTFITVSILEDIIGYLVNQEKANEPMKVYIKTYKIKNTLRLLVEDELINLFSNKEFNSEFNKFLNKRNNSK